MFRRLGKDFEVKRLVQTDYVKRSKIENSQMAKFYACVKSAYPIA